MSLLKLNTNIWLILALSIFAWGPLLTPAYFFNAHDAKHSVFFLVEFDQTFRDGYLWPRWSPDFSFGYGYPLFNLYAPLAFYGAELVHLLGFRFTAAVKVMYILATIAAGLGMYGFVRRLYGEAAGVLAAVFYMYVPFHLVEIYVRSAFAEFVALAIVPFLFWAFTELIVAPSRRQVAAAGFAYGVLALTHHTSFFTFTPFLIIYILYLVAVKIYKNRQSLITNAPRWAASFRRGRKRGELPPKRELKGLGLKAGHDSTPLNPPCKGGSKLLPLAGGGWEGVESPSKLNPDHLSSRLWELPPPPPGLRRFFGNYQLLITNILYPAAAGILGIALAAVYLIPMLTELQYVKLEQWTSGSYNYLQHFVYFSQFFSPEWGYGYAGVGLQDDFSFQLGIVSITLLSFTLVLSLRHSYPHRNSAFFFLISTIVAVFTMSPAANILWQVLPIASLVQFPWRLLALTAFTMSVVAGALIPAFNSQLTMDKEKLTNDSAPVNEVSRTPAPLPPLLYLLSLVIILASFSYTVPQYTEIPTWAETPLAVINWDRASIVDRVGMMSITDVQPQTSPMEQQYLNGKPLTTASIIAGQGTVEVLHHGGGSDRVRVVAGEPVTLQFYTYDYPGWQVMLNDKAVPYRFEPPYGLITVDVPAGEHTVEVQMGNTVPRIVGSIVSFLALLAILALAVVHRFH